MSSTRDARQGVYRAEYDFFAKRFKKPLDRSSAISSTPAGLAPGWRRRGAGRTGAPGALPEEDLAERWLEVTPQGARARAALQRHAALRSRRNPRRTDRAHVPAARPAGRDRWLHVLHPAGLPSREHRAEPSPGPTGFDDLMTVAVSRLMLDNFDHIKAYWIMITAANRADGAEHGRGLHRRNGGGREDRPHGRRQDTDRADDGALCSN